MTEQWENSDGLRELTERLRRLDSGIPVPESVKAPQLLARLEQNAQQPVLRVVRPRWQKAAGIAAAFVVLMGGVWLTRGFNGMNLQSAPAQSSMAAQVEEESADYVMPAAQGAPETAAAPADAPVAELAGTNGDYAAVRERLAALQGEEEYYTAPKQTVPDTEAGAGGGGAAGGPGTGGGSADNAKQPSTMARSTTAGMAAGGALTTNIVRTEGSSLYYLTIPVGSREPVVKIVDMNEMSVESTISFPRAGAVSNILVEDGMLAVLYSDDAFYTLPVYERQVEQEPVRSGVATVSATVLELYDVSNGAEPVNTRTFEQQGDYVYARVEDNAVSLVTDCSLITNARNTAAKDEELVPALRDSAVSNEVTPIPAGGISLPEGAADDRYAVVSLVSLTDTETPAQTKAVLGGTSAAYGSDNALYVAGSFAGEGKTGLLKITVKNDTLTLAAQGNVPGHITASDAMNEWNGSLRVVTTTSGKMDAYTLDSELRQTNALALYGNSTALCFAGDVLYLTDTKGGVMVARFSDADGDADNRSGDTGGTATALYALPDGRALALGYDTQKNLEAVLYDTNGKRVQAVTLGGRGSVAAMPEQDAFSLSQDGLLALPVLLYGQGEVYNGAVVLKITEGGIVEQGRVQAAGGMSEDALYAGGLDVRQCAIVNGQLVLLSRAQATSYALPGLAQQKTTML